MYKDTKIPVLHLWKSCPLVACDDYEHSDFILSLVQRYSPLVVGYARPFAWRRQWRESGDYHAWSPGRRRKPAIVCRSDPWASVYWVAFESWHCPTRISADRNCYEAPVAAMPSLPLVASPPPPSSRDSRNRNPRRRRCCCCYRSKWSTTVWTAGSSSPVSGKF